MTYLLYLQNRLACFCFGAITVAQLGICNGQGLSSANASAHRPADLPQAEAVFERYLQAIGGREALAKIKSIEMKGTLANDLLGHVFDAEFSTIAVVPNRFRLAMQHPQSFLVRVTDGKRAWQWRSSGEGAGETQWLDETETRLLLEKRILFPEQDWRELFQSIETTGIHELDGKQAYEVQVTTLQGDRYSRFYDLESGLLVKTVRETPASGMGFDKRETRLERYQEFDGILLATRYAHTLHIDESAGTQIQEFSSVTINGPVNESLFEVPPELKASEPNSHNSTGEATPHRHHGK